MGRKLQATSVPRSIGATRRRFVAGTPASALATAFRVRDTAGALGPSGSGRCPAAAADANGRAVPASTGCLAGAVDVTGIGGADHASTRAGRGPGVGGIGKLRRRGAGGPAFRAGARISPAARAATCNLTTAAATNWPMFATGRKPTAPIPFTHAADATTCKLASGTPADLCRRAAAHTAAATSTLPAATAALGAGERVSRYLSATHSLPCECWPVSRASAG